MRAVIQRVSRAQVSVDGEVIGKIGQGLVVLLGVAKGDNAKDAEYLANKIIGLRIFEDVQGKMNCSLGEIGGAVLVVSQFTLLGDCRKGRRPGFDQAASPEEANLLYQEFIAILKKRQIPTACGKFQAHMSIEIHNDGPVTFVVDSK
ncbi:MAG: D-tyrosyl-tRNA(Tyr) deacylase [Candidatus Schekmanbacteria bacterium]|nr:D-tyrosyl-tRNA(Tyr) deacylase [Candidatus Schekmanbacteria bacterium]